ncbi:SMP-30/gluconolactonase/LRE family protein [Klebsiella pneumoniae]
MTAYFCKNFNPNIKNKSVKNWRKRMYAVAIVSTLLSFNSSAETTKLETVVESPYQANGIAVAQDGRIFLGLPRWVQKNSFSVGLVKDGKVVPYPGDSWNEWSNKNNPQNHFININALRIEPDMPGSLWVVDCAEGRGGSKLVEIDTAKNAINRVYHFDSKIVPVPGGCLNDVRIVGKYAFLTESGLGAIIVLDLETNKARRVLSASKKTKAVSGKVAVIDGVAEKTPEGTIPVVNADGIEISPDKQWLYFCMPLGGDLWRVRIDDLLNTKLSEKDIDKRVENMGVMIPVGGILMLKDGSMLLSDVENHAIKLRHPDGSLTEIISSPLLDWPDAMAIGPDGKIYTDAAQANKTPSNNGGKDATKAPFRVLRFSM